MFVLVVGGGCRLFAGCFINLGWWVRVRGWVFGWRLIGVVCVVLELVWWFVVCEFRTGGLQW